MLPVYDLLWRTGGPLAARIARSRLGPQDERWFERLGQPSTSRPPGPLFWLHAASVGEGVALRGLARALRAEGFDVGAVGNAEGTVSQSVVRHGPGMVAQARTVAAAVPGSVLQGSDAIGETVQLVIGPGFDAVVPGPPPAAAAPEPVADTRAAAPRQEAAAVRC